MLNVMVISWYDINKLGHGFILHIDHVTISAAWWYCTAEQNAAQKVGPNLVGSANTINGRGQMRVI